MKCTCDYCTSEAIALQELDQGVSLPRPVLLCGDTHACFWLLRVRHTASKHAQYQLQDQQQTLYTSLSKAAESMGQSNPSNASKLFVLKVQHNDAIYNVPLSTIAFTNNGQRPPRVAEAPQQTVVTRLSALRRLHTVALPRPPSTSGLPEMDAAAWTSEAMYDFLTDADLACHPVMLSVDDMRSDNKMDFLLCSFEHPSTKEVVQLWLPSLLLNKNPSYYALGKAYREGHQGSAKKAKTETFNLLRLRPVK